MPRTPFTPLYAQNSSPFHATPTQASRANLVPQNYQPSYPDFSQAPAPAPAESPDAQMKADIAQFFAGLSADQRATFVSGMNLVSGGQHLNTFGNEAGNTFFGHDTGFGSNNDDFDNEDFNSMELNLIDTNDMHGLEPLNDHGEDGMGPDDVDKPWNTALVPEGDHQEDTDSIPSQDHAGAQSSLQVTMQDIDVTKKRKRRRPCVENSSESEDDDADKDKSSKKKTRKKRKERTQRSRSIRDITSDRQQIVKHSYALIQKSIAISKPWPAGSESGDPTANDDELDKLIRQAWNGAIDILDLDPEDYKPPTTAERNLIVSRISQLRGSIVAVADVAIPIFYKIGDPQSLPDPTPAAQETAVATNRDLIDMLQTTFNPNEPGSFDDMCRHPAIQYVVNKSFFAKTGAGRRAYLFEGMDLFPVQTLALVLDAIICAIDRWKTGEHDVKAYPFSAAKYGAEHVATLDFLRVWIAEFKKAEKHPVDLATECLKNLLKNGRQAAGISAETAPRVQVSRFPMHLFAEPAAAAATSACAGAPSGAPGTNGIINTGGDAQNSRLMRP
ncbi:hypothetical protein FB45DRAFT_875155 [Roridomyces roridus]|uniref:DUF6532 domain-containing protein n=1 Tax=Roridomyces roridus TaxID=1738132 RepID=A0AAD7B7G8_9AGAR|nr:hypothetical protein FB45DRAFT_875155 [Roridomyces roridus]